MVLQGDRDVPFITGLLNTVEWLTDYNNFYEKRFYSPHWSTLTVEALWPSSLCFLLPGEIGLHSAESESCFVS